MNIYKFFYSPLKERTETVALVILLLLVVGILSMSGFFVTPHKDKAENVMPFSVSAGNIRAVWALIKNVGDITPIRNIQIEPKSDHDRSWVRGTIDRDVEVSIPQQYIINKGNGFYRLSLKEGNMVYVGVGNTVVDFKRVWIE